MGFIMDIGLLIVALQVVTTLTVASTATLGGDGGRVGRSTTSLTAIHGNIGNGGGGGGGDAQSQMSESPSSHAVLKRSFGSTWSVGGVGPWSGGLGEFTSGSGVGGGSGSGSSLDTWNGHRAAGPSPAEVANAIAMAKQASQNVLIAQQQVQAAKDNVLHQQRLATDKETHASILTQKSEAAAAIQRSEAAAAAQSVILAQQRLAAAKSMVAQQQRIAAAKEAQAATFLHNSAHAAAAEIQRTEQEAARLASEHRSDSAAAQHHLSATKDVVLGPLHSGNNHVPNYHPLPSYGQHAAFQPQSHGWPHGGGWSLPVLSSYGSIAAQFGGSNGHNDWQSSPSSSYDPATKSGYNLWG